MFRPALFIAMLAFGASVVAAPAAEAAPVPEANPAPTTQAASSLVARTGEYLGGIDMDTACRDQWFRFAYAYQKGNSCNAWNCREDFEYGVASLYVDVNSACTKQHGVSAYGWCTKDAWDWKCYKN
jgi:hypothetical protein